MIVGVNFTIPGCEYVDYLKDRSLRDFDIAVVSPEFPCLDRIYFDAGGSCLSIESTERLSKAMLHWKNEILIALSSGKTIFFIADKPQDEQAAIGSESKRANHRTYSTTSLNSYSILPSALEISPSKGKKIKCKGSLFQGIVSILGEEIEYRSVINTKLSKNDQICTRDDATIGGVLTLRDRSGSLVILPYFDFESPEFHEENDEGQLIWTVEALRLSAALEGQLVAIDKELRENSGRTPPPDWISLEPAPLEVSRLDKEIEQTEREIKVAEDALASKKNARREALAIQALLFENGKSLESAIERALTLMGYSVENYRHDDLEIDHIIVSPEGQRYVGESEGKDSSAIDIKKFRQLESNINEDFEREDVDKPARGILFGNGYRFTKPNERPEQFTRKSLTNANRLGSILVRTTDLYPVAVYLLDHPDDEGFKESCRLTLARSIGEIVEFPPLP